MANVGYRCASTQDWDLWLWLDALAAAGCGRAFEDRASGACADRHGSQTSPDCLCDGEVLVIWKLLYSGKCQ